MKFLILGTSNSILKGGWVDGFAAALPGAEIKNASVGASPGFQFLTSLRHDLGGYDAVFFDSVVNDQHLGRYVGGPKYYDRLLFELISSLASRTRLIVLGFSSQKYLETESRWYEGRRVMAHIAGAEFVGFNDIIRSNLPRLRKTYGAIYENSSHYQRPIANALGRALADALGQSLVSPRTHIGQDFSQHYHVIPFGRPRHGSVVTRKNSFARATFTHYREGALIHTNPRKLLIGAKINAAQTSCTLRVDRPRGGTLDLCMGYDLAEDKLMTKFVPFLGPGRARTIEVLAQSSDLLAPHATNTLARADEGHLEISEILLRDPFVEGIPPIPTLDAPPVPSDLHLRTALIFENTP